MGLPAESDFLTANGVESHLKIFGNIASKVLQTGNKVREDPGFYELNYLFCLVFFLF